MNWLAVAIAMPLIVINWFGQALVAITTPIVDWLLGGYGGSDN